ncbi:unnamed protein product [Thelazia callipaeda]|uniref:Rhodanese domain-containing protein n=1 Tax=Thelazia callipaeda TaxID=103827 RepID=A0A0N5CW34_THECL|nr:unnamed protein product [Thelazia callipaeda]
MNELQDKSSEVLVVKEHNLSNIDVQRYSRQILLQEFGVQGQEKLQATSLLIAGVGGLGCNVALYCAGAGIGRIGIVDGDLISSDNLHRQVAYGEDYVSRPKAHSLRASINRYLINDACMLLKKPLVSGSVLRWDGHLSVYGYGQDCPCYRCLYPHPPSRDAVKTCSDDGVMGPVVGVIGCMQANEIIKIAANVKCSLAGYLYIFDGLNIKTKTVKLRQRNVDCLVCGDNASISNLEDCKELYECSAKENCQLLEKDDRVGPLFCLDLIKKCPDKLLLMDVRPAHEFSIGHLPYAINIPMTVLYGCEPEDLFHKLNTDINEMKNKGVYVICRRGNESQEAVIYLREKFADPMISFKDVDGGYENWFHTVDHDFPLY